MYSYSSETVRAMDAGAIASGVSGFSLMQNAARALVRESLEFARSLGRDKFVIFYGPGNNGGDALVAAEELFSRGFELEMIGAGQPRKGDALTAWNALPPALKSVTSPLFPPRDPERCVVIDALLGTGAAGELRPPFDQLCRAINASNLPVISVDVPSGLSSSNGVIADLTVTFAGVKSELLTPEGVRRAGRIVCDDIAMPPPVLDAAPRDMTLFGAADARKMLGRENFDTHKFARGLLIVFGGSSAFSGAPLLTGEAALRAGAGVVRCVVPEGAAGIARAPKALIVETVPGLSGVFAANSVRLISGAMPSRGALVCGMGVTTRCIPRLVELLCKSKLPLLLDADALTLAAQNPGLLALRQNLPTVLTPHPGEAARLQEALHLDNSKPRHIQALELAAATGATVVLKGARTVTAAPDTRSYAVNLSGCAALATAGSGDLLSGVIGAFMAQQMPVFDAARLGVFIHGLAAELAAPCGSRGVIADDLTARLPEAIKAVCPTA